MPRLPADQHHVQVLHCAVPPPGLLRLEGGVVPQHRPRGQRRAPLLRELVAVGGHEDVGGAAGQQLGDCRGGDGAGARADARVEGQAGGGEDGGVRVEPAHDCAVMLSGCCCDWCDQLLVHRPNQEVHARGNVRGDCRCMGIQPLVIHQVHDHPEITVEAHWYPAAVHLLRPQAQAKRNPPPCIRAVPGKSQGATHPHGQRER
mmetsp:Transcript_31087/g.80651  ORF Transcript_31087/g.80651 Transcript_31087/m.80651 type:complete len:203 (-) Transcript_31087:33-641(-)